MFRKAEPARFSLTAWARRDSTALLAMAIAAGWLIAAVLIALML